ncbi:MAG: nitroreductase family protein [Candidatus Aenigmatarchaeota archaeon]
MIDAIKKRRSVRSFKDRDVEDEKLEEILKAASYSPSAKARYPWSLVVVKDEKKREKFSKSTRWSSFASDAPVVIAVTSEDTKTWVEDSSIVAEHIQLEATNQGLGACWIHIRDAETDRDKKPEERVKDILNVPEDQRVLCLVAIGYPDEHKKEHPHKKSRIETQDIYEESHGNEF